MKELEYPFDSEYLLKKKRAVRKALLAEAGPFTEKKIAVLGGSTTHDVIAMLELFLLNQGIRPQFYESEYGRFWQDAMFPEQALDSFQPDLIYIHTSSRNIRQFPEPGDSMEQTRRLLEQEFDYYRQMWQSIEEKFGCPVIQNNFELPYFRLMGNRDASDPGGRVYFITSLNQMFYDYARSHDHFYIQDILYLSASFGLERWSDPFYWHMYKYALCVPAIPALAFNLSNIIKSMLGKNKKALAVDLDNTLWGGVVGDDGPEGLAMGPETSMGQVYGAFQSYLKALKKLGILLNVNSKNDPENALAGLNHPDCLLKPDDFIVIQANWENKDRNILEIARTLNILPESIVFVDDNPAERAIVRAHLPGVAVPEMEQVEHYIETIDRSGFFEVTSFSGDDRKRNEMYRDNVKRAGLEASFADYGEYLKSLEMKAVIRGFEPVLYDRITQLTNKSNQFNLTTKRCTQTDIVHMAEDDGFIDLYGRLTDRFGDNGVVSVVIGEQQKDALHIRLWLMSCRVLKRGMEQAMMDGVVKRCRERNIGHIYGYYYPTAKNNMVKNFYQEMGFEKVREDAEGNTVWRLSGLEQYENKNQYIEVEK